MTIQIPRKKAIKLLYQSAFLVFLDHKILDLNIEEAAIIGLITKITRYAAELSLSAVTCTRESSIQNIDMQDDPFCSQGKLMWSRTLSLKYNG